MQQERALILIDGSNFYFKLRDLKLHQLLTFDFTSFSYSLIGILCLQFFSPLIFNLGQGSIWTDCT